MLALALVGFKLCYELGRGERELYQMTLRPGQRYRITGPDDAVWVMVGLSTWRDSQTDHAEVTFVDHVSYVRDFGKRARR